MKKNAAGNTDVRQNSSHLGLIEEVTDHREIVTNKTTLAELLKILGPIRKEKTPTPKKLREEAGDPIAVEERIKVYRNGFAVYDNGYARTVVWIPYCASFTHYFHPLKESEKGYEISQKNKVPMKNLLSQPWPISITLLAEHRIERTTMSRKGDRKKHKSEIRDDHEEGKTREDPLRKAYSWHDEQFGEDPETTYLRWEKLYRALMDMTEKQRRAFILYYYYGYTQEEIAGIMGITKGSVSVRIQNAVKTARKKG